MAKNATLDDLERLVTNSFAKAEKNVVALAEDVTDIKEILDHHSSTLGHHTTLLTMITGQLTTIEDELRDINRRIDALEEQLSGLKGFAQEIDELRARLKEIERHLGLEKKIAA